MARYLCVLCLFLAIAPLSGCSSLYHALCGESDAERHDREKLAEYRKHWSTPGRTSAEIETEARGTFKREHGRDPQLNWHAR